MTRYYYSSPISKFLQDDESFIFGKLSAAYAFDLNDLTKNSWFSQIRILKDQLKYFAEGQIYFEFSIPRMGKRVDNVLVIDDKIFLIEFKTGEDKHQKHAIDQVLDYALDLQNFHEGSHNEKLIPVLVSTNAIDREVSLESSENLFQPIKTNKEFLAEIYLK